MEKLFNILLHFHNKHNSSFLRFLLRILFQFEMKPNIKMPKSIQFKHAGFKCVINENAIFGENVIIQHGVSIIAYYNDYPTIGDNVYIGCNSTIMGNIKIGNNVKIGACTFVREDIPDNSTVVGNPCRIINKSENK